VSLSGRAQPTASRIRPVVDLVETSAGYGGVVPTAAVLLFDADCGFCTRSAAWLGRIGLAARIEPLQGADLPALGVDATRAAREIPFVSADGVSYGAEAIGRALATGSAPWQVLGALLAHPPLLWPARWVYRLVAAHRHRLPGGRAACRL
jgi:predicted DCC family thiol-disulfide oxidoreductase YuxK